MRALQTLEERHVIPPGETPGGDVVARRLADPRRAALLSIVPGLGQLYNGETGKGILFLAVSAANLILILSMVFFDDVVRLLAQTAASWQMELDWNLVKTLKVFKAGSAAFLIYIALLVSYVTYAMREAYDHARRISQGTLFARYFLGLPEATSGSYLVHFAVTAACTTVVMFLVVPPKPPEQAIDIELVEPEPPPPPPRAPEPEKPKAQPKPVAKPPEPVKPRETPKPPQPNQVAVAVPTTEPTPLTLAPEGATTPESQPQPATGGGGSDAGGAGGEGEAGEVDFGPYLQEMQRKIKKAWFPPKGNESKRITVKFKIKRSGDVRSVRLVESSGLSIADNACIAAVEQAAPFGPLPQGADDEITIKFTFDYNVFSGEGSGFKMK